MQVIADAVVRRANLRPPGQRRGSFAALSEWST